ncbi:uncharacterized protein LOC142255804 [Anomaloglossus baeobatrachus]|uniref:uncharacterized protein LOC142255804 n=1 Tax=Anomaloglossus baeobatrachus TaxID=238106 RepID=UPI003F4F75DB
MLLVQNVNLQKHIETSNNPFKETSCVEPCWNRLCEPVVCNKVGTIVTANGWIDECCPHFICECKEACDSPPTCESGLPPLRTQDPEEYCCPEYVCVDQVVTPEPTTQPPCEGITCFIPTCGPSDTLVKISGDDLCCDDYECVPPITNPPPVTQPNCDDVPACPDIPDCFDGVIILKSSEIFSCCPTYDCVKTTPTPIFTAPPNCGDVSCEVKECYKEGQTLNFVGWLDPCCRDYECKCLPCSSAPKCEGGDAIMTINPDTQCCPTYVCPPPPTKEPGTTIISSTIPTVKCEDRECPVKVCDEHERLVTQINPADPCCPTQTCECACKTIPSCENDERLVAIPQSNQCCPKLKCERKADECYAVPTQVTISSGQCSGNVILSSCSGFCHSKTEYSSTYTPVSQCRCCSVTRTQPKTFQLPCPDGTKTIYTVQEASECGCNKCSEEEGSGNGSGGGSGSGGGNSSGGGSSSGSSEEEEGEGSGFSLWSSFGIPK